MLHRIEDWFAPAFYRPAVDGGFEVFVLADHAPIYVSIGVYKDEGMADRIMNSRTFASCMARKLMSSE